MLVVFVWGGAAAVLSKQRVCLGSGLDFVWAEVHSCFY